jgi:hypothetical protein
LQGVPLKYWACGQPSFGGSYLFMDVSLFLIIFLFRHFSIQNLAITVFMPIFCIYHSFTADEWMVNEFGTKAIAYLFCLHAWLFLLQKKFIASSFLLGIACSFHLLVGSYFSVLIMLPTAFLSILNKDFHLSFRIFSLVDSFFRWILQCNTFCELLA